MTHRSWFSLEWRRQAIKRIGLVVVVAAALLARVPAACAGDAPQWLHALADAPLPAHDDETNAVLLDAEKNLTVSSSGKLKVSVRRAYKILRPKGRDYGYVAITIDSRKKVVALRAWCIPPNGKDYQVKDKEAVNVSLAGVAGSELITDIKDRIIEIPDANPGSIVGYEYETEEEPLILQDVWTFQSEAPVRQSRYSLELPSGWTYQVKWTNYPESKPSADGNNRWRWSLSDIKRIRKEEDMPPLQGVAGQMIVYLIPPGESVANTFTDWKQMGQWYGNLTAKRADASADVKQNVATLTASATTTLSKMQAIAQYVQRSVRYVAIELGIGGYQPHSAAEVFDHHYGDCKDKATLTIAMLREIGVDAYYVVINARRGAVTSDTPPHASAFNHAIVAIRLPEGVSDPSLVSVMQNAKYGKLLLFDPTNDLTPFGQIGGYLQANWGLLVLPSGGELIQLPTQAPASNTIQRTAKFTLGADGMLKGDVKEVRTGDKAWGERRRLHEIKSTAEGIKPIENVLGDSLTNFRITVANILNINKTDQPFGFDYSFEAPQYAKSAGDLILLRPRILGVKAREVAITKEPRLYPYEFSAVTLDTDSFDITIPTGYTVDDLPSPFNADYNFASYHSSVEVEGQTIHYRRTYEIKQLSVPVDQTEQVKKFYQLVASDERSMVVLKSGSK